jgi:hypothetical protein
MHVSAPRLSSSVESDAESCVTANRSAGELYRMLQQRNQTPLRTCEIFVWNIMTETEAAKLSRNWRNLYIVYKLRLWIFFTKRLRIWCENLNRIILHALQNILYIYEVSLESKLRMFIKNSYGEVETTKLCHYLNVFATFKAERCMKSLYWKFCNETTASNVSLYS